MKKQIFFIILIIISIIAFTLAKEVTINSSYNNNNNNNTILSRTRRYLVFPEGSSFQVVYDLTYPSVALQGNVFVFGNNAAMAWELPSKPIFLDLENLMGKDKEMEITTTNKEIPDFLYHENNDGHYSGNPGSGDGYANTFYTNSRIRVKRTIVHHIHRKSRRKLYNKIEKLLTALGRDGKECILKAICQVSKIYSKKGTFWEEIIKAIFRSKIYSNHPNEDHYDVAFNDTHNCEEIYEKCKGHVLSNLFKNNIQEH